MCFTHVIEILIVSLCSSIFWSVTVKFVSESFSCQVLITLEEFRLILSEVDKYGQMKVEIPRGRQKEGGGLSEAEKKAAHEPHERRVLHTLTSVILC